VHARKQGSSLRNMVPAPVPELVKRRSFDALLAGKIVAHVFSGFPGTVGKKKLWHRDAAALEMGMGPDDVLDAEALGHGLEHIPAAAGNSEKPDEIAAAAADGLQAERAAAGAQGWQYLR
jgi:hypothetical protein